MAKIKKATEKGGPYLAAAVLCETIIEDKQDSAMSAIRIVDRFTIALHPSAPKDFPSKKNRIQIPVLALLMFKTGDFPGDHTIRVDMESPSGKTGKAFEQTVPFPEEPNSGVNMKINVVVAAYKGGLFWMRVFVDGKLVTKMPCFITIQRAEAKQSSGNGKPAK